MSSQAELTLNSLETEGLSEEKRVEERVELLSKLPKFDKSWGPKSAP